MTTTSFESFLKPYRVVFCDAYGVLNDASGIYPQATQSVHSLRTLGTDSDTPRPVFLLTNDAASPMSRLSQRWQGVFSAAEIISSGRIYADYLEAISDEATVVCFCDQGSLDVFADSSKHRFLTTMDYRTLLKKGEAPLVDKVAMLGCIGMEWSLELNTAAELLRLNPNCTIDSPNPDLIYSVDDQRRGIAIGSLAMMLQNITGREVQWFGKPEPIAYEYAFYLAQSFIADLKPHECLMIGDTVKTDILGASLAGWDSLLVLSGVESTVENAQAKSLHGFRGQTQSLAMQNEISLFDRS